MNITFPRRPNIKKWRDGGETETDNNSKKRLANRLVWRVARKWWLRLTEWVNNTRANRSMNQLIRLDDSARMCHCSRLLVTFAERNNCHLVSTTDVDWWLLNTTILQCGWWSNTHSVGWSENWKWIQSQLSVMTNDSIRYHIHVLRHGSFPGI